MSLFLNVFFSCGDVTVKKIDGGTKAVKLTKINQTIGYLRYRDHVGSQKENLVRDESSKCELDKA